MTIDQSLLQVALWFIPGVICAGIVDRLTNHQPRGVPEFAVRSFSFGVAAYVIYFTLKILRLWPLGDPLAVDLNAFVTSDLMKGLKLNDVLSTTIVAALVATGWSFAANHKLLIRVMQRLHVTRKFGDENVWDFTFNMGTPNVEYTFVRDFGRKIVYSGWVSAFSEGTNRRELLLKDVELFDLESGNKLFEMPLLYLSFSDDSFHIEFPYR